MHEGDVISIMWRSLNFGRPVISLEWMKLCIWYLENRLGLISAVQAWEITPKYGVATYALLKRSSLYHISEMGEAWKIKFGVQIGHGN